jgi:ectoine hydroxylase-related dioxygenase (phytanoyl-CoA dioxygenase family)
MAMTSLQDQYKRDGYVLLKGFFDPADLNALYRDARQVFARQIQHVVGQPVDIDDRDAFENAMYEYFERDFAGFVSTGKTVQHLISLHRLGVDENLLDAVRSLGLAEPVIAVRPAMQFNSRFLSKDGSTHWKLGSHQDWRTGQGSLDSLVLWFPLVPADAALGALQIIPGSHTRGLMAANTTGYAGSIQEELKEEDFVQTEYELGDLLLFSAFLIHRSGNNVTRNIRWSVQLRYNNLAEPTFIERGYPMPYLYKPQEELVTPDFPSVAQLEAVYR